ncbi:MAG: hypothetical protein HY744_24790 [Deltaproteobacteria bacterium]|nr:hypothetical protein [Deltaproteobacteria bacterium]
MDRARTGAGRCYAIAWLRQGPREAPQNPRHNRADEEANIIDDIVVELT